MSQHDTLTRFLLPSAGVRGVHVRLDASWREILSHATYPPAATVLLGEACVATALFTGHTKVDGRLSVQLRSTSALRTLFAECTAAGSLRGIVQLAEGSDAPRDLHQLGEDALLAITIENPGLDPREPQRYQSLVELSADNLGEAFENYFRLSEQLPTRLLLAASSTHAAGLLLQKLPGDTGDTGDTGDSDGWTRACALFDTLQAPELLENQASILLHRLFHEESPSLLGEKPLRFGCSCSQERVAAMLHSLGEDEARAAAQASGSVDIRCEFCGREYHFSLGQLDMLFGMPSSDLAAPEWLQ